MEEIFGLTKPFWEILLRSTVVYFGVILLMRVIPKRNAGTISPNDILTLIVIGGMATDAIMGGSNSLGDALSMIGLVVGWGYLFDFLEYRFPSVRGVLRHNPRLLIDHGRMVRRNMRAEMVTEEELMAVLRMEGIDDITQVRSAFLEADGEISVIRDPNGDKGRSASHKD